MKNRQCIKTIRQTRTSYVLLIQYNNNNQSTKKAIKFVITYLLIVGLLINTENIKSPVVVLKGDLEAQTFPHRNRGSRRW